MPLKFSVDSLDDVSEAHRDLYAEKDGKFVLAVDGLEDNSGLKKALETERETRKKYEKDIKAWQRTGKSPDEIAELIAGAEEAERLKNEKEGNFDAILKQHQGRWDKEKADLASELEAARASERSAIINTSLMAALTKAGATEEGIDLLPDRLSNRIKFDRDGDKRVINIVAADGVTPLAGSSKDGTATFDDLVKEALDKYPSLFKGSGAGGSGKQPDSRAGRSGISKKSDFKSEKDRAAWVQEHGVEKYKALPD
ncbi:hypothetical protein [Rhizobium phaseoli]|uniref:Phage protein n=1 Tax=Rhizobium phaseoli TaxID=396 RepID=A0ABN4QG54_9HYPH|nr:hypothetical protein [Rhizobium phaseoli]ANL84668.1 hypothetical protein AMC81_CH01887 [Rhizobium phaseoli]ANL91175.1 hypothetical protein AMC80_CH01887 [Rhizobium phaseoli]